VRDGRPEEYVWSSSDDTPFGVTHKNYISSVQI